MTLSARVLKESRLFLAGRGADGGGAAEARAERRRRPATWAGFRPVILRSTSTMVIFFVLGFLEIFWCRKMFFVCSLLLSDAERERERMGRRRSESVMERAERILGVFIADCVVRPTFGFCQWLFAANNLQKMLLAPSHIIGTPGISVAKYGMV